MDEENVTSLINCICYIVDSNMNIMVTLAEKKTSTFNDSRKKTCLLTISLTSLYFNHCYHVSGSWFQDIRTGNHFEITSPWIILYRKEAIHWQCLRIYLQSNLCWTSSSSIIQACIINNCQHKQQADSIRPIREACWNQETVNSS